MGLRTAIIGFGGMGQRHYAAYEKFGVLDFAICDVAIDRVKKGFPRISERRLFSSLDELLEKFEPEIASVVTNAPSHAEVVIRLSNAGVPRILCEKPMATNLRDARRMVEACEKNGTRLAINHLRRFSPNHRGLKSEIERGLIGRLRHIYVQMGSSGLGNNGPHYFDLMRYYLGSEIESVIGSLDETGTPNVRGAQFRDPAGFGILFFRSGARGVIDTFEDTGVMPMVHLVGEYGRVVIDEFSDDWKVCARSQEDRALPLTRFNLPNPCRALPVEFSWSIPGLTALAIENISSEDPVLCSGEDGYRALEAVMGFHASQSHGQARIKLPLSGKELERDVPFA